MTYHYDSPVSTVHSRKREDAAPKRKRDAQHYRQHVQHQPAPQVFALRCAWRRALDSIEVGVSVPIYTVIWSVAAFQRIQHMACCCSSILAFDGSARYADTADTNGVRAAVPSACFVP